MRPRPKLLRKLQDVVLVLAAVTLVGVVGAGAEDDHRGPTVVISIPPVEAGVGYVGQWDGDEIRGSAEDPSGLGEAKLTLTDPQGRPIRFPSYRFSGHPKSGRFSFLPIPWRENPGKYVGTVEVTDVYGNIARMAFTFFSVTNDRVAPRVRIIQPKGGLFPVPPGPVRVHVEADDGNGSGIRGVVIRVHFPYPVHSEDVPIVGGWSDENTLVFNLRHPPYDAVFHGRAGSEITIEVEASDGAENLAYATERFRIGQSPPPPKVVPRNREIFPGITRKK